VLCIFLDKIVDIWTCKQHYKNIYFFPNLKDKFSKRQPFGGQVLKM